MERTSSNRAGERKSQLQCTRGQLSEADSSAAEFADGGCGSTTPWNLGGKIDHPRERNIACSACSMKIKKAEKWQMPAASVSENSTRRSQTNTESVGAVSAKVAGCDLLSDIWHKSHEPSALDRFCNGVLAGSRAARLAATYNSAMTVDQLRKELNVFVVHIHWTRTLTVDEQRVLLLDLDLNTRPLAREFLSIWRSFGGVQCRVHTV